MWASASKSPSSSTRPSSATAKHYSSSSSYAAAAANPRPHKTMEEVWRDINLPTDLPHPSSAAARGMFFQDFFSKDPPSDAVPTAEFSPPPPPPTILTLNSVPDHFGHLLLHPHHHPHHLHQQPIAHVNVGLDALVPEDNVAGKKRFPDPERSSGERRHKRMIKNRESAARSRARKQAYTNELELEVAHLLEENARLKEQQQQIFKAAAAQNQNKKPLQRTSTAPF